MDAVYRFVAHHPIRVLVAVVAVTALFLTQIVDPRTGDVSLKLDPSIDSMLPAENDELEFYTYVRRLFGSDELIVVALHDEDGIFTPEHLRTLQRLTDRLGYVDGVHHVVSLANALNMRSVDGDLVIEPFVDEVPEDPAALAEIRDQALSNPIYRGSILSEDAQTAALFVYLLDMSEQEFFDKAVDPVINAIVEQERGTATAWVTGGPHIKAETSRLLLGDLGKIIPMAFAIAAMIGGLSFRSLRGVLVPVSTIAIAAIWTLGTMAASGRALNVVTIVVPILIIVVGFAYAIHVVSDYYEAVGSRREEGEIDDRTETVLATLRHVGLPVLLTGATTAAGFLSLATNSITAIREFAVFSTVGVLATLIASLTFVPACLRLMPMPRESRKLNSQSRVDRLLVGLAHFNLRYRTSILVVSVLLAAFAVAGIARIQVSTDMLGFRKGNIARRDFEAINHHLAGSGSLYIVIETDYRDAFKDPVNLEEIIKLQRWLEDQPEIGATISLADYVMLINRGFNDNDPEYMKLPESKRLITQLLYFAANDELESFADSRFQTVSILVRSKLVHSGDIAELLDRVEARLTEMPEHLRPRVTGNTVLITRAMDDIAWGQSISLLSAFGIIYVILALLFTSFRVGFLALIPNVLPVLAYFGILGWTGITLNITTGLVACLVLGIAVDDTIHFLARFNAASKAHADESKGVVEALRTVGRPVTFTTIALCLGFLTMVTSRMTNQVEFGALAATTLALAWLVDVTFTPALAARMRIVTLWDVLSLDLGESPHLSIPLLHGLSPTQARIAALMMSVETFPKGHKIFEVGDAGDAMYVVIDGQLQASLPSETGTMALGTSQRGDAVGEVALFYGKRTADVHAVTDVRLIQLTNPKLERLQRRYPRIGAQLYVNLSNILAKRLASATERLAAATQG